MSNAFPQTTIDHYVSLCVSHLRDHSAHYFSLIQKKNVDGVLWAVFRITQQSTALDRPIELVKASFLPLSSMVSSKADVLLRMQRECDQLRQFVSWFTLDDGSGSPLASKVLLIDVEYPADAEVPQNDQNQRLLPTQNRPHDRALNRSGSAATTLLQAPAGPNHNDSSGYNCLTPIPSRAPFPVQSQPQQFPVFQGHQPSSGPETLVYQMQHKTPIEVKQQQRSNSPKSVRELFAAAAMSARRVNENTAPSPNHNVSAAAKPQQDHGEVSLQTLLRMVMHTADSVAAMGTALDSLGQRCQRNEAATATVVNRVRGLEHAVFGADFDADGDGQSQAAAKKVPPILTNAEMLVAMTEMSVRLAESENRIRVLESQNSALQQTRQMMFEQFESLRSKMQTIMQHHEQQLIVEEQRAIMHTSHLPPVNVGGIAQARDAMPYRNAQPAEHRRTVAAVNSGGGKEWSDDTPIHLSVDENRSSSGSPWRQALESHHATTEPVAFPSASAPASSAGGSLTDMIKALENKLGGIRSGR